jgi:hypothetical protein
VYWIFRKQKDFSSTPVVYKTIDLDFRLLQKSHKKAVRERMEWPAGSPVRGGRSLKALEDGAFGPLGKEKYFSPTPIDSKTIDLDYKLITTKEKKRSED